MVENTAAAPWVRTDPVGRDSRKSGAVEGRCKALLVKDTNVERTFRLSVTGKRSTVCCDTNVTEVNKGIK
ncbi:hypothetical protein GCM10009537_00110 [Corynebacterium riegelii]